MDKKNKKFDVLQQYFQKYGVISNTNKVDMSKLPIKTRIILNQYLSKAFPDIETEVLLLYLLEYICYICAYNDARVKSEILVKSKDFTAPINMYTIIFKHSGAGKDNLNNHFRKDLLSNVIDMFRTRKDLYHNDQKQKLDQKAKVQFPDSVQAQHIFKKENEIREPRLFSTNGTVQGLFSDRYVYSKAGFGSSFYVIREAGSFFKTFSRDKEEIIEILNIAYDLGITEGTSIKKESEEKAEFEVPSMFHMHGSAIAFEKPQLNEKILEILEEGMARRSYLYYSGENEADNDQAVTIEDMLLEARTNTNESLEMKDKVISMFDAVHNATKNRLVLPLTREAEDFLILYQKYCLENKNSNTTQVIKVETEGRFWKAFKIAGALQLLEDPNAREITEDIIKASIYITECYGANYKLFENRTVNNDVDKVYKYILTADTPVSARDIKRKIDAYRKNVNFDKLMTEVEEIVITEGYELYIDKNKKGARYEIRKPVINDLMNLTLSQSDTNKKTDTTYKPLVIPWQAMHQITGMNKGYSFSTYKDAHRAQKNALGIISLIGIDVDGGFPLEEAKEYIEKQQWTALIVTTKSHQKTKITESGKEIEPQDRYRIILPLKYIFKGTSDQYKQQVQNFFKTLPFKPDMVTEDIARFWFGNPKQEFTYFAGELFDFSAYQEMKKDKTTKPEQKKQKAPAIDQSNQKMSYLFENNQAEFLRRLGFTTDGKTDKDGGRNDFLARVGRWLKDEDMNVTQAVDWLNEQFYEPLPEKEISTILKSIGV